MDWSKMPHRSAQKQYCTWTATWHISGRGFQRKVLGEEREIHKRWGWSCDVGLMCDCSCLIGKYCSIFSLLTWKIKYMASLSAKLTFCITYDAEKIKKIKCISHHNIQLARGNMVWQWCCLEIANNRSIYQPLVAEVIHLCLFVNAEKGPLNQRFVEVPGGVEPPSIVVDTVIESNR